MEFHRGHIFIFVFSCIIKTIFICHVAIAEQKRDAPQIHGSAETCLQLQYEAAGDNYSIDVPFYGKLQVLYKNERVESVFSIDYIEELGIGETYLLGGIEYSNMKIGYYVVDWGRGYSYSPVGNINMVDSRYPSNIFYSKKYLLYPCYTMTLGSQKLFNQIYFANREENIETIDDTELGLRGVVQGEDYTVSLGFIRKLGYPPALFFLTAENRSDQQAVWMELSWEYHKESHDVWTFVLGVKRQLVRARLCAEYIIDRTENYLYIEEAFLSNSSTQFSLKGFFHIPDLSSAFNGFISVGIDETITFEPGVYLFFGKRKKYFSPLEGENNNSVYFRLVYEF
jgi:hypothetical protein